MGGTRIFMAAGAAGFIGGLLLLRFAPDENLRHLALIVMVAAPVIAFWRIMKPRLAPHCPRPPEPGSPL
ncbi:MAG TPA: hypothetical protein VGM68_08755 [Rhizomicrobium sp.]